MIEAMKKILLFLIIYLLSFPDLSVFASNAKNSSTFGKEISYNYDANNRLIQILTDAGAFEFTYDSLGRRIRLSLPNGTYTTYTYDTSGRLTNLAHRTSNGSIINNFTYTYDKVGNVLTKTETDIKYTYIYDAIYRLIQVRSTKLKGKDHENKIETYTYDSVGNRFEGPELKDSYTYNQGNQLISDRKHQYQYDGNGNLIKKTEADDDGRTKTWTYTYNYENRLIKVTKQEENETKTVTFKYDQFGRRIKKEIEEVEDRKTETKTSTYVYDNEDIITEELTKTEDGETKTEITRYIHGTGIDEPLVIEQNGNTYYYHADGLGSIIALTDEKGKVVQIYEYDSFGNMKQHGDKVRQPYAFTGREWDEEIGLFYYRTRYYDPKVGRFTTKDPSLKLNSDFNTPALLQQQLENPQKLNPYVYVINNPVKYIDPSGLFVQAIPMICAVNPALCVSVGAITIGTITQMFKNPPIVPSIPLAPPKPPEQCKDDDWRQQCINLYTQCINDRWEGPCGVCLNKCTAQHEWDFKMCHPRQ